MPRAALYCILLFLLDTGCNGSPAEPASLKNRRADFSATPNLSLSLVPIDTLFIRDAPNRITRGIKTDRAGNLLFAAFTKIIRFDGKTFTEIPKPTEITEFNAYDAAEDRKGNLWIADMLNGIYRFDGKEFIHFTGAEGLVHNRTMHLTEDQAGNIWIGTMSGVSRYNGDTFHNSTTAEGLCFDDVSVITEDYAGRLWFGTREYACVYDPATAEFTRLTDSQGKPFFNIWEIVQDSQNNVWLGGENGLWRYDGSDFTRIAEYFVNGIAEDRDGNIFTISPDGSLNIYDRKSLAEGIYLPREIHHSSSMPFALTKDRDGKMWVGTGNGVFSYDGEKVRYFRDSAGIYQK